MSADADFASFFEAEYENIYRVVCAVTRDQLAAEEATQAAFVRCLERWRRLRNQPWRAGWVATTALNLARRALRRRQLRNTVTQEHASLDSAIDLARGLRQLPRRQQEAVFLHYGLDLKVAEIAHAMRCSEGTVKTHLSRARQALRKSLEVNISDG
jgi:RNA polymerase sigma-70 factor, ECF subfamily